MHEFNLPKDIPVTAVRNADAMAVACAQMVVRVPGITRGQLVTALEQHMQAQGGDAQLDRHDGTVTRWLERAVEKGLITREGVRAGSTYHPTPKLRRAWVRHQLARPLIERTRVGYQFDFLMQYSPNKTHYLSQQQRDSLARLCPPGSAHLAKLGPHQVSTFLCDLVHWSSHLEGSEYGYADTVRLIEQGIAKSNARGSDATIIRNHHEAVRFIIDNTPPLDVRPDESVRYVRLNRACLQELHARLSDGLLEDDRMCGRIRHTRVKLEESAYLPMDNPQQLNTLFGQIVTKAARIRDPWECAMFLSVHIPYLQPFEDMNKRTARVGCNIPLLRAGVTPMSWTDVPRRDYLDAMVAIYEHQEVGMLADLFVAGYERGHERLAIMRRERAPDEVATRYRAELKLAVRARVLEGRDVVPDGVSMEVLERFQQLVEEQLNVVTDSPISAVRFGLTQQDVRRYARDLRQRGTRTSLNLSTQAAYEQPAHAAHDYAAAMDATGLAETSAQPTPRMRA